MATGEVSHIRLARRHARIVARARQRLDKQFRWLRPGDAVSAVEDKVRNARNSEAARLPHLGVYRVRIHAPGQRRPRLLTIESGLAGQRDQRRLVEDRPLLGEVGSEEALDHLVLEGALPAEMHEAMRVEGVAGYAAYQMKLEPFGGRGPLHLLLH